MRVHREYENKTRISHESHKMSGRRGAVGAIENQWVRGGGWWGNFGVKMNSEGVRGVGRERESMS